MSNPIHDYSRLKTFDIEKDLFDQDFQKELCTDDRFVPFSCIKIDKKEQLFSFFQKVYDLETSREEFFYRGQSNSDWLLVSTLEREVERTNINIENAKEIVFRNFKQR